MFEIPNVIKVFYKTNWPCLFACLV